MVLDNQQTGKRETHSRRTVDVDRATNAPLKKIVQRELQYTSQKAPYSKVRFASRWIPELTVLRLSNGVKKRAVRNMLI